MLQCTAVHGWMAVWEWALRTGVARGGWVPGVSVFRSWSLLPTLEFSAGLKADGRLVLVPEVVGEVSVRRPKPRREEGW